MYIYSFIPMSGCALLLLGSHDAVKMALLLLLLSKKQCPCVKTALNTHLSYIPSMLMLKMYRPRWTQYDDNTLHDPLDVAILR
jgi:hypothetical protein